MTPALSFNVVNNCWISTSLPSLRIDETGITIHDSETVSIDWLTMDRMRDAVRAYPRPCSDGRLCHENIPYNNRCTKCGLTLEQIYGPVQMAKWEAERKEQREFDAKCKIILPHLFMMGFVAELIDAESMATARTVIYQPSRKPESFSEYRKTNVDFVFRDGFQQCWVYVQPDIVDVYGHFLSWPEMERKEFRFGVEPVKPTPRPMQPAQPRTWRDWILGRA